LEMTPRVHDNEEVSLHVDIDISQVSSYNDLGGISQPVISQRKATLDVRMRDGQINIIGGLIQIQDTKTTTGVPGLASIPIIGRLFSGESIERDRTELLIALVPHIVRGPDLTSENLRTVYAGNQTNYAVRRAPVLAPDQAPLPTGDVGNAPVLTPQSIPPAGPTPATPIGPAPAVPAGKVSFVPAIVQAQQGASFTTSIRIEGAVNLQSIE
jgi:general secretion pathway protein D